MEEKVAVEIVAAMDVPVAVDARRPDHYPYPCLPIHQEIGLVEGNVALPAQSFDRSFQQGGKVAAVGLMAVEAILHDGRVLKNEGAPVLGVATKAQFPIAKPPDEMVRGSPVRVVATGAVHFPLAHGMMRKPHLGADLLFMTGGARIRHGQTGKLSLDRDSRSGMDRVALDASDAVGVMRAARPEKPLPLFMALETDLVLHGNRGCRPLRESNLPRVGFASGTDMLGSRSMTRFTPKFLSGVLGVLQKQDAHSRLGELLVHLGVTGLADFRAYIPLIGLSGPIVPLFCFCWYF